MGNQDRAHASKRTSQAVMPTVEEIVAEAREARAAKIAGLVSMANLASALGRDRSNVRKAAKKLGIKYALVDIDGTSYFTGADASVIAERLA